MGQHKHQQKKKQQQKNRKINKTKTNYTNKAIVQLRRKPAKRQKKTPQK